MRVLAFGTYDVTTHPRVRVLIDGLREHGIDVREIVAPLGLDTAQRVRMLGKPWLVVGLATRLARRWGTLTARALRLSRDQRPTHVLVGYLGHFDVLLARVLFPRATVVLDHLIFAAGTARDRGVGTGLRTALLSRLDRLAIAAADIVVTDTDEHARQVPATRAADVVVVPVGATEPWFAAGDRGRSSTDGPLAVIFYGLFTPLQGTTVIAEALRRLDQRGVHVRVTLVGGGQDAPAVRTILATMTPAGTVEVTWPEWVESDDLPDLVSRHDVCLGIFGTTDKARHVVPNKVFQGAAAGCAVITSDTTPQRRVFGDGAIVVPPGDAEALAAAIERLTDSRDLTRARADSRETARRFTAAAVVEPLIRVLHVAPTSPVP